MFTMLVIAVQVAPDAWVRLGVWFSSFAACERAAESLAAFGPAIFPLACQPFV